MIPSDAIYPLTAHTGLRVALVLTALALAAALIAAAFDPGKGGR